MRNPKHFVVRLFAVCGIVVCAVAVVGGFLHSAVATWHPDFPPMSLPSAMVFIIYGIALCILSNGPRNGNGGAS